MPTIPQYPRDTDISATDLILGADQGTLTTVTYRIDSIAAFVQALIQPEITTEVINDSRFRSAVDEVVLTRVETDVPVGALFTDTQLNEEEVRTFITSNYIQSLNANITLESFQDWAALNARVTANTDSLAEVQQFAKDTTTLIPFSKFPDIQYGDVAEFDTLALLQASSLIWHVGDLWIQGITNVHIFLGTNDTPSSAVVAGDFRTLNAAAGNVARIVAGTNIEVSANVGDVTVGIDGSTSSAITANTAKTSYPTSASSKLATLSADSVVRQTGGATIDPIKFWSGTKAQYDALVASNSIASDILYNITDSLIGSGIVSVLGTANEIDVDISASHEVTVSLDPVASDAIAANTAKVSNIDLLPTDNAFTGVNTFTQSPIFTGTTTNGSMQVGGRIVHHGDEDTYINMSNDRMDIHTGGENKLQMTAGIVTLNPDAGDIDFRINKLGGGTALYHNAGADTITIDANTRLTNGLGRETGGSTTDGLKVWTGTQAQYTALTASRDQNTIYYITDI